VSVLSAPDLAAYLVRIGHAAPAKPDLAGLATLHTAHVGAIPFENLDVRWGRGIALDLPSLVAKLVHARRGGYCFEQNGLFAAVLATLGYAVRPLAARVRFGATRVLPRTHQLLLVEIEGEPFVADVGFGAQTLLAPLPLARGTSTQAAWRYRLDEEDGLWVLRIDAGDGWADLYAFTLAPQVPADAEMANWYVSTHPASRFVQTTTVQRATPQARHTLRDREYTVDRGHGDAEVRRIGDADLDGLLRGTFGLDLAGAPALPLPPMR
jgi:N-hydroxyarylamine O-acetyltransferase